VVEYGSDKSQYFGGGGLRFHNVGLRFVEDLSNNTGRYVVFIDDGSLGRLIVASRLGIFAPVTVGEEPDRPGEARFELDLSNTGGCINGGHVWGSECEYDVMHLQVKDYPFLLGYDMKGGLPKCIPTMVRKFFAVKNIQIIAIVLVSLQADVTVLAESHLPGVEMRHALNAARFVIGKYSKKWNQDNKAPVHVCLMGVGTKQLWLPSDPTARSNALQGGK
jgi:hypothetical protein